MIYVNTALREPECDLAAFIKGDLEKFRNRHPNLKGKAGDSISTFDEKKAEVRYFTGDQWDNHEAVAYLQEEKVFVIIVLTSRTEAAFRNSLDAFRSVVKSYHFLTSKPEDAVWDHAHATLEDELALYNPVRLVFVFVFVSSVSEDHAPPENFCALI